VENDSSRIGGMSITPTVARQTVQNDFGAVFARTAQEVARVGGGVVSALVPGNPVVSAAVSGVRSVVSAVAGAASAVPVSGGAGATTGVGGSTGRGESWDLLEAQKLMQADGQKFNVAYMQMQNEMQRESREHNALSNIMKVRHDSAKAAINNIR
jgi:hypothetical protein